MAGVVYGSLKATAEVVVPPVSASAPASNFPAAASDFSLQSSVQLPQFVEPAVPVAIVELKSIQLASKLEPPIAPSTAVPLPGSAQTTASTLLAQPETLPVQSQSGDSTTSGDQKVAQDITPGRATRSSSSYFGVGGNIGILGDRTAVGNGSFAILSKIGLTDRISFRPALLFGDRVTFLLPVTYDFSSVGTVASYSVAPYVGAGFAINTGGDDTFNLLGTAGVDIPLGSQFTANAGFNVTFLNGVSFGLLLGLGYNF